MMYPFLPLFFLIMVTILIVTSSNANTLASSTLPPAKPTIIRPINQLQYMKSNSLENNYLNEDKSKRELENVKNKRVETSSWTISDAYNQHALNSAETMSKPKLYSIYNNNATRSTSFLRNGAEFRHQNPELSSYKQTPFSKTEIKRASNNFIGDAPYNLHVDYDDFDGENLFTNHHEDHGHHLPKHHHHHFTSNRPTYTAINHHKEDFASKLGLITIIKIIFAKFKTFWIVKFGLLLLFLIKIPFLLLKIALKFLFMLKFVKLLKLITLPSLIPLIFLPLLPLVFLLLPLLLIPLVPLLFFPFLLPLFLPLLLLFRVPVLARPAPLYPNPPLSPPPHGPPPTHPPEEEERERRNGQRALPINSTLDLLLLTRRVMESEECMEKLACEIAENQTPRIYSGLITRILEMFQAVTPATVLTRLLSYTNAFRIGADNSRKCSSQFLCSSPPAYMGDVNVSV